MEDKNEINDENINKNNNVNENSTEITPKDNDFNILTPEQLERKKKTKKILIIASAIILPALIIFIIKQVQIKQIRKAHNIEISLIKEDASSYVKKNNEKNIKIISRILSWAVSDAIKIGQLKDAAEYMVLAVKENNFKQIMVVNHEGLVTMSTDKRLEGSPFINPFPQEPLHSDSVRLRILPSGDYMTASSMYNIDFRQGVLIITSSPDTIPFKDKYN